jgi:indole-3-glycerol phosphate synthase
MILDDIVAYKKRKVALDKQEISIEKMMNLVKASNTTSGFKRSLKKNGELCIIAEVKKASPSKGVICENFDPVMIAIDYQTNKADALSILTEDHFFMGKDQYLKDIRSQVDVPLLRKDFIIDDYQIYQSKMLGADAILLIAAILDKKQMVQYKRTAEEIGLEILLEVHDRAELETALELDAAIIGINNRNLKTFETHLVTTEELIRYIPNNKVVISESGIHTRKDMIFLQGLGVSGVLVGESLMRSGSIGKKLNELRGYGK